MFECVGTDISSTSSYAPLQFEFISSFPAFSISQCGAYSIYLRFTCLLPNDLYNFSSSICSFDSSSVLFTAPLILNWNSWPISFLGSPVYLIDNSDTLPLPPFQSYSTSSVILVLFITMMVINRAKMTFTTLNRMIYRKLWRTYSAAKMIMIIVSFDFIFEADYKHILCQLAFRSEVYIFIWYFHTVLSCWSSSSDFVLPSLYHRFPHSFDRYSVETCLSIDIYLLPLLQQVFPYCMCYFWSHNSLQSSLRF